MGWPPLSYAKGPRLHPHCRRVTPQRELLLVLQTFTPPSPPPPPNLFNSTPHPILNLLLLLQRGNTRECQRSSRLGGEVTRPRLQSRVHSTPFLGHQSGGHMKGLLPMETGGGLSAEPLFLNLLLNYYFSSPPQKLSTSVSINTPKIILCLQRLFLFPDPLVR